MISIAHLTKDFGGDRVLQGVSFELARGEIACVLGPSGAGKSTLLRCINGLLRPTSGTIRIDGMSVERKHLAAVRRRVGFIFQSYQLVGSASVLRNVLIGRLAEKAPWNLLFSKQDHQLATEAIISVGLGEKRHARVDELSGGQKQRVGIARALAHDPEVLLADEPISNLDPVTGREILALLQSICRERGTTLLCNLHNVPLATAIADRVLGLKRGILVFNLSPGALGPEEIERLYGTAGGSPQANLEMDDSIDSALQQASTNPIGESIHSELSS